MRSTLSEMKNRFYEIKSRSDTAEEMLIDLKTRNYTNETVRGKESEQVLSEQMEI